MALIKEGKKPYEVAKFVKRFYATVLTWLTLYNDYGREELNYSPSPGQPSWLTPEQKE